MNVIIKWLSQNDIALETAIELVMVNKAKRSLMKSALSHLAGDLSSVRGPAEKGKIMRWREMQRQQAQLFQADIDTLGQNQAQVRFFLL